jgi:acyl carrier protein
VSVRRRPEAAAAVFPTSARLPRWRQTPHLAEAPILDRIPRKKDARFGFGVVWPTPPSSWGCRRDSAIPMAVTLDDVAQLLDDQGLRYSRDEQARVLRAGFETEAYRNKHGDAAAQLVLEVDESGEWLRIFSPAAYNLAECRNLAAVLEVFAGIQWRTKLVCFEYDSGDGEIRPAVTHAVEDTSLSGAQLSTLIQAIPLILDSYHPVVVRAIETGVVDFDIEDTDNSVNTAANHGPSRRASRASDDGLTPSAASLEILSRFVAILAAQLGVDGASISAQTRLADLNIDSLDTVELTMEVEEEFEIVVGDEHLRLLRTVGDVARAITALAAGEPVPPPELADSRRRTPSPVWEDNGSSGQASDDSDSDDEWSDENDDSVSKLQPGVPTAVEEVEESHVGHLRSSGQVADPPGTIINSIGMKLVPISPGRFLMGAGEDDPHGDPDEEQLHSVQITGGFYLGMHQVTQQQYERVAGANPSVFKGGSLPVEHLSWKDAKKFCELLSALPEEKRAGRAYRLPTEAEWEYACRAGTTTPFNTGESLQRNMARFSKSEMWSPQQTAPVGSYPPNAWGLFDMHGNVWEWTADWFASDFYKTSTGTDPTGPKKGSHHTLRGGSASVLAHECRSAIRGEAQADGPTNFAVGRFEQIGDFGCRVACDVRSPVPATEERLAHAAIDIRTFDLKREVVDPLNQLRKSLCEITTRDTASRVLPPGLLAFVRDGVGHPLIMLALVSDLLRVVRDAIYVDDSLSMEEEGFVAPIAWGLINQLAKHRKEYAAAASAPERNLRNALQVYSSDSKPFGYCCSATKWAGAVVCRQVISVSPGSSAREDYLAILRKLAIAILSIDKQSGADVGDKADGLLADVVSVLRSPQ